jgi:hypothetical protein
MAAVGRDPPRAGAATLIPHSRSAMDREPLFTVIIPTRNRAEYLRHTLRTCAMQDYQRLEVVVADDASTDNTREVVEEAARLDPRIRFAPAGTQLGMRDNFERALTEARPGFVIALGGDDGLLPGGIGGMKDLLQETGANLLTWPAPIFRYPHERDANGQLAVYWREGTTLIDSRAFLRRQAENLHYLSDVECPMFYVKGVAATTLVEQVRRRSPEGRFYSSPTPDGYSGIVLAGEVARFAFSGRPFAIYGLSSGSQGQAYLSNDSRAKRLSEEFVSAVSTTPMHRDLASQPYSPLITLMTADYLLTASDLPGWPGRVPPIDYRRLLQKGIGELANGLYGDERIVRELRILSRIADQHGLGEFYRNAVRRTPRRKDRELFKGTGVNAKGVLLSARAFGIRNIFDAAYATQNAYQMFVELRPRSLLRTLTRSAGYRWRALGGAMPFPPESAWNEAAGEPPPAAGTEDADAAADGGQDKA